MKVLLTGMSGVGKSTILKHIDSSALKVDLDYDDWIIWDDKLQDSIMNIPKLIDFFEKNHSKDIYLAGTAINQKELYLHLDCVITLTAPLEVMKTRIQNRTDNSFGKTEAEWTKIKSDKEQFEARIMESSHGVISTDKSIEETIQEIYDFCQST